jgi:hypothetical protein
MSSNKSPTHYTIFDVSVTIKVHSLVCSSPQQCQIGCGVHPTSYPRSTYKELYTWEKSSMRLTTHLHLALKLIMCRTLYFHSSVSPWCGAELRTGILLSNQPLFTDAVLSGRQQTNISEEHTYFTFYFRHRGFVFHQNIGIHFQNTNTH